MNTNNKTKLFGLIFLLGIISLFGDIMYEGTRSISGPYLKLLGATAFWVGFIFGLGEFLNYALRIIFGYLVDTTQKYWLFMYIGYGLLFVVPLLSFANTWHAAAFLMIMERVSKSIRSPAKFAILSFASQQIGTGLGFGIHEFLDQVGALIGPLFFSYMLANSSTNTLTDYQHIFSYFWLSYLCMIIVLITVRLLLPQPRQLETEPVTKQTIKPTSFSAHVYLYLIFIAIATVGFINFALIGYHLKKTGIVPNGKFRYSILWQWA